MREAAQQFADAAERRLEPIQVQLGQGLIGPTDDLLMGLVEAAKVSHARPQRAGARDQLSLALEKPIGAGGNLAKPASNCSRPWPSWLIWPRISISGSGGIFGAITK